MEFAASSPIASIISPATLFVLLPVLGAIVLQNSLRHLSPASAGLIFLSISTNSARLSSGGVICAINIVIFVSSDTAVNKGGL